MAVRCFGCLLVGSQFVSVLTRLIWITLERAADVRWQVAGVGEGQSRDMLVLPWQLPASIDFLLLMKIHQADVLDHHFCFSMVVGHPHSNNLQCRELRGGGGVGVRQYTAHCSFLTASHFTAHWSCEFP